MLTLLSSGLVDPIGYHQHLRNTSHTDKPFFWNSSVAQLVEPESDMGQTQRNGRSRVRFLARHNFSLGSGRRNFGARQA